MLFGCIMSATDPVAVVAVLNNLGKPLHPPGELPPRGTLTLKSIFQ